MFTHRSCHLEKTATSKHLVNLLTSHSAGTFFYRIVLLAFSWTVQPACKTSEDHRQGKFSFLCIPHLLCCYYLLLLLPLAPKIVQCLCPQMDRDRCNWDGPTTRLFLDLCIAEKDKFNFTNQGLTRDGWHNVQRSFKELAGARYTNMQMSNKLQALKKRYRAWKDLHNTSGPGRNKSTVQVVLILMPIGGMSNKPSRMP